MVLIVDVIVIDVIYSKMPLVSVVVPVASGDMIEQLESQLMHS